MDKKGSFFTVTVRRQEVIAAALPLQDHRLPLSNLDLLLPPLDVGVFFCYGGAGRTYSCTAAETLKSSLARVLVPYYPFAGEMVSNAAGEPEILCNNRGVDFIEARADVELADLRLHEPDDGVGMLVPKKKHGVLCIQATELKCGGLVVGCAFDHRVADAYSANMFFVAWAEAARWVPASCAPSFERSLLGPSRRGYHDASIDDLFVPRPSLPPPSKAGLAVSCVSRIYSISADDISQLQALASATPGGYGRTKIEAFTAYLWQVLGGAQRAAENCTCSLGVIVDGRSRMRGGSLGAYFGNVLSVPYATLEAEELRSMELREVADEVHEFIAQAATGEHFLGLIDWVEAHRPAPAMSRLFTVAGGDGERTAVLVSSGRGFPVQDVDFGWGRPAFGSYYCPWSGGTAYVMPFPDAGGDGDWLVYVHMSEAMVKALETVAGEVFRPAASARSERTTATITITTR